MSNDARVKGSGAGRAGGKPVPAVRRLRTDDAPDVLAAFRSSDDMSRQGTVTTLTEAERYVAALIESPTQHAFAITDADRLVGLVGVTVDEVNLVGWFWYWMNASHRGRRWASQAATAVANWALSDGGLERLELGHRASNPFSGNVAGAAGFVREGRERAKFLIDGERHDVLTYGRLTTAAWAAALGGEFDPDA